MKAKKPKTNLIIDAVLFGGFLITFFLNLTGVELHQWIGIGTGALAIYHLLVHWGWVRSTAQQLPRGQRLNAVVDALVGFGLLGILSSGLALSSWLELPLKNQTAWHNLHVFASVGTLLALAIKIALHWRWVVAVARRFAPTRSPAAVSLSNQATEGSTKRCTRREFIKLMSGVGIVTFLAAANVLDDAQAASTTTGSISSSSASSLGSSKQVCRAQCNRGCSFPGHCRRYTDTNNNGRCDLGECAT